MTEVMVEALPIGTAQLKLGLMNAQAAQLNKLDLITRFTNKGLPQEVVTRLEWLWDQTKIVAGEVIQIGKILLMKIWEWVQRNPNMLIGMAIGAAIGALTSLIPFIGPLISPIAIGLGVVFGGATGAVADKIGRKGGKVLSNLVEEESSGGAIAAGTAVVVAQGLIYMATEFFRLFASIFLGLKEYFVG